MRARLARLKREVQELQDQVDVRNQEAVKRGDLKTEGDQEAPLRDKNGDEAVIDGEEVASLSRILQQISVAPTSGAAASGASLAKRIVTAANQNRSEQTKSSDPTTYTVTYEPTYQESHVLAKTADFDHRLALLEKVLGLQGTDLALGDAPQAILPTVDSLQKQLTLLTESTPASLDAISRRVRSLIQDAERLEESRKSAKAAQDALRAVGGDDVIPEGGDPEQIAKINALYGTLPTIETVSPLLPPLLDRLRSLRTIHADAAMASENLGKVEQRQVEMDAEIKRWREGLEKVELSIKQNATDVGTNMEMIEGWVKNLEGRIEALP